MAFIHTTADKYPAFSAAQALFGINDNVSASFIFTLSRRCARCAQARYFPGQTPFLDAGLRYIN